MLRIRLFLMQYPLVIDENIAFSACIWLAINNKKTFPIFNIYNLVQIIMFVKSKSPIWIITHSPGIDQLAVDRSSPKIHQ
ncbi:hypothetical protein D3C75_1064860 [compost metagenome]